MGCLVKMDIQDLEGHLEVGDFLEARVPLEHQAKQDFPDLMEHLVSKEILVQMVSQACRVSRVTQDCPVQQDLKDHLDQEDQLVHQDLLARLDPREMSVLQEPMACRVQLGRGDPMV